MTPIVARWRHGGEPGTPRTIKWTRIAACTGRPSAWAGGCSRPHQLAVMAIVNRTPDSFFDQGATFAEDAALRAVEAAVAAGADIIDIGGVKAGPGDDVDPAEEIRRTVSTVAAVRERFPDVVISIDTWRAEVAAEAVAAGADLLNDTWAGADPELAEVAARDRGRAGLLARRRAAPAHPPAPGGLRRRRRPTCVATVTGLAAAGARARRTPGRAS